MCCARVLVAVPQRMDEDGEMDTSIEINGEGMQAASEGHVAAPVSARRASDYIQAISAAPPTTGESFSFKKTGTSSESQSSHHCVLQFSTAVYYCAHSIARPHSHPRSLHVSLSPFPRPHPGDEAESSFKIDIVRIGESTHRVTVRCRPEPGSSP
jgi:hypothetical protein